MKHTIIAGKLSRPSRSYEHIPADALVGKRIEAVAESEVPGAYGDEPCTILYFEDGTRTGFVHPADDN